MSVNNVAACYGCGMCVAACPKHCIHMVESDEGFYVPQVDSSLCVQCGLCAKVCPKINRPNPVPAVQPAVQRFAAWIKDEELRYRSSSGGIVMAVARELSKRGYRLCGVKYVPEHVRAEHFIAERFEDFSPAMGSKYIQSFTEPAFSKFEPGVKYFVVGTPCQIYALRRWIVMKGREDDFFLMDFFCHGVPSSHLWRSFLRKNAQRHALDEIDAVWRSKERFGWEDSWCMTLKVSDKTLYSSSRRGGCWFYHHFLRCDAQNLVCYDCPFNNDVSGADLRCADLWGNRYSDRAKGVSLLCVMTKQGGRIWDEVRKGCFADEVLLDTEDRVAPDFTSRLFGRSLFLCLLKLRRGFVVAHYYRRTVDIWFRIRRILKRHG